MDTSLSYCGSGSSMIEISGSGGDVGVGVLSDGAHPQEKVSRIMARLNR